MMIWRCAFYLFVVLFTSACIDSPIAITSQQQHFSACKKVCQQQRSDCGQVCHDSCLQCNQKSFHQMQKRYIHYKHEQDIRGEYVMRDLHSYADPLQCNKTTCECPADYSACVQACAGKIRKRLQVAPKCVGC